MLLYKTMNPNVVLGIATGGAFLFAQVAMAVLFRSQLSFAQYFGLTAIIVGMMFLAMGGKA